MKKVEIYTTPTCAYCRMAKELFEENKIEYIEYDVSRDQKKAEEMIEKTGQMGVPVIIVDGEVVIGFDRARLSKLLEV